MKVSLKICIALLFCLVGRCQGQGWRGIVPLHSTCEDVRGVFKTTTCEPVVIDLKEASVFVSFSDGPCLSEWNVPRGTVISLDVTPKDGLRLADLQLDITKYTRTVDRQVHNTVYFNNQDQGISITAFEDGRIRHLFYGPTIKDSALRCDSSREANDIGHGSVKFDEYDFGNFSANTLRLDKFATTLAGWLGATGYIIVYPGQAVTIPDAQVYANQAKRYLLENSRIVNGGIVTIIGGFREEPSIQLFIMVKGGNPPTPSPQRGRRNP
jgi:hypothetical protein